MKFELSVLKLKKEAILLDSTLYIFKSFVAVIAAYIIAHKNPILKLDTISVLFGLMLTLEPVNLTGIRNGLNQLYSTILGALSTAVIIYVIGINVFSIALSIAFTLYVCLKIDWRAVSPVAIFTSIYMTQYVQKTTSGDPSILLTFRLRIYALVTGVLIAIIFNYLFSRFYYKSMLNRRVAFILDGMIETLDLTIKGMEHHTIDNIHKSKNILPASFNNIDWVFGLFQDIKREYKIKSKVIDVSFFGIERLLNIVLFLRTITHLNYDINYTLLDQNFSWNSIDIDRDRIIGDLNWVKEELKRLSSMFHEGEFSRAYSQVVEFVSDSDLANHEENYIRIVHDIKKMKDNILEINNEISKRLGS